jgi:16S rRNA (guanine527-N7)-methyltransferase
MSDPGEETLAAALTRHQIELSEEQVAALDRYRAALWALNEHINLTRHTTIEKFVGRDVVDSLAFSAHLETGDRVLDVGTGGGVPGVVLAIARPDLRVELCESVAKRAKAIGDIARQAGLAIPVHHARAESLLENEVYDVLVVRAVASLAKLLTWFAPRWNSIGRLLVLKGPAWLDERGEARHLGLMHDVRLRKLAEYPLPGTDSQSVLLELRAKE